MQGREAVMAARNLRRKANGGGGSSSISNSEDVDAPEMASPASALGSATVNLEDLLSMTESVDFRLEVRGFACRKGNTRQAGFYLPPDPAFSSSMAPLSSHILPLLPLSFR